jgi:hypothetical protein
VALSHREYQVLRQRPCEVFCLKCLTKLASALPEEPEPVPTDFERHVQYGASVCSKCGRFSPVAFFVQPEEVKMKAATET